MSRSNNSRKGSKYGNWAKEFWSKRAGSQLTGWIGAYAKKLTNKIERQMNKPKKGDFE
jgi:hypothetical protein